MEPRRQRTQASRCEYELRWRFEGRTAASNCFCRMGLGPSQGMEEQ